jgi:hypothetical protein
MLSTLSMVGRGGRQWTACHFCSCVKLGHKRKRKGKEVFVTGVHVPRYNSWVLLIQKKRTDITSLSIDGLSSMVSIDGLSIDGLSIEGENLRMN